MQADTLAEPVRDAGLKGVAGIDRRVIEDDQTQFPGAGRLGGEGVESGDDGGGNNAAGGGLKVALVGGAEESQDIQARASGAGNSQSLATPLPSVRNSWGEIEIALVEIKHLDHPLSMVSPELAQARVRRAKGGFVAGTFNPPSVPFPAIGFF